MSWLKRVEKIVSIYSRHRATSKVLESGLYELEATTNHLERQSSNVFCLRKLKQPKIDFILRINRFVLLSPRIVTILILVFQNCPENEDAE